MGKCIKCGRDTLPGQEYCMNCKPRTKNLDARRQYYREEGTQGRHWIPNDCMFQDSFYDEDGYLKRSVFLESAEKMSYILQKQRMTQASIRSLFGYINSIKTKLKADRNIPLGYIRENFLKFVTHTEYQVNRGVIPEVFKEFVDRHKDLAIKSKKEFLGFADYLTSIVARMKQK